MLIAKRCLVAGRVQGVFYRASAQQQARKLQVTGHARNRADGCVEVLMVGEAEQLEVLIQWLWQGSPASQVMRVEVTELELAQLAQVPSEFTTA